MRENECVNYSTCVVSSGRSKLGFVTWVIISEKHQSGTAPMLYPLFEPIEAYLDSAHRAKIHVRPKDEGAQSRDSEDKKNGVMAGQSVCISIKKSIACRAILR